MKNVFYISRNYRQTNNAANKPKTDIEIILDQMKIRNLGFKQTRYKNSAVGAIISFFGITKGLFLLPEKSYLVVQYPLSKYFGYITKVAKFKGARIVLIIHDVHSLMRGKISISREMKLFSVADKIIVHNESMERWFGENGCKVKVECLYLFDYLNTSNFNLENQQEFGKPFEVVVAGGLSIDKSAFIYKMDNGIVKNYRFNLYGNGFSQKERNKETTILNYMGSFSPDQVARHIKGSFGLVWGGNSIDECGGILGEYLKYNNPHKTSLYILCGLPIIVWKEAAIAKIIEKEGLGIVINSLRDLDEVLSSISVQDYSLMCSNVLRVRNRLTNGGFLKDAIERIFE